MGGAGVDTASYSTASSAVSINLLTGVHTGDAAGDVFDGIEVILGSSCADTFVGDANANTFNGGNGTDTISYAASTAAVNVSLVTGKGSGGDAEGDVLSAIEMVVGSAYGDTLASSTASTTLSGGAGDDVYVVGNASVVVVESTGGGRDEVQTSLTSLTLSSASIEKLTYTGTANFTGIGQTNDNIITGGVGSDTLIGGAGADTLVGGAGVDTASYSTASSAVSINLLTGVHTGDAAGDVFDGIEVILGSSCADTFVGDANANTFNGGNGTDTISYAASTAAVNVSLVTGKGSGGDAEGDVLSAIEMVVGSAYGDTLASSTASTTLSGGAGDDVYVVGNASVVVVESTGGGRDEVQTSLTSLTLSSASIEKLTYTGTANFTGIGQTNDNIITGGVGSDTLIGGAGADTLVGGAGVDTASYSTASSAVSINLLTGVHTGDAAGDVFDGIEVILGSSYADTFVGTAGANTFDGGSGIDTISYAASTAAVNVSLVTGKGSGGDAEGDVLSAIEMVVGSAYGDTLASSTASTTLSGGAGDDVYVVGNASVVVVESTGGGTDEVQTSLVSYALSNNLERLTYTGTMAFTGTGNASDNLITGGAGNDTLIGGAGADTLIGGDGVDTASYSTASSAVSINLLTGVHTGDAAGDVFDGIEVILGSSYADTFVGDANANTFNGGNGTDTISYAASTAAVNVSLVTGKGSGGDAEGDVLSAIEMVVGSAYGDTLASSTASTTLSGGAGDDVYVVGNASVVVVESTGGGRDEVQTSLASYTLTTNVEKLTYTGTAAFTGTGNASDNVITGGAGNDTLIGGAGADTLIGGTGADKLIGGTGNDVFVVDNSSDTITESVGEGIDTVNTTVSAYTLGANVENLTYLGSGSFSGSGNALDNVIIGGADADTLQGNGGADILIGGGGADSLIGGAGQDTYMIDLNSGSDVVDNRSQAGDGDKVVFGEGVEVDQLWFSQVGNDLLVSIIGTSNTVLVADWYLSSNNHVAQFVTEDGATLSDADVQNLVSAMAAFSPPALGQSTLTAEEYQQLDTVIAANWKAA